MTERQIGLRKRTRPFTQVPNDVVDDWTIGYRELGVLVRILRMPDGFVIRSEQLSTEGKNNMLRGRPANREGREAVRTALRNLAIAGYYRLVRQRMLDGTFAMATDVSEDPDEVWAAQAAVFGGRPVALVEQRNGELHVKYPDGTLLPDGDMPPAGMQSSTTENKVGHSPKPRNPSSDNRAPGNPASGEPESGDLGAFKKMVSKDGQQDSEPAPQVRRPGSEIEQVSEGQITIDGKVEAPPAAREITNKDIANEIARVWIGYWSSPKKNTPIGGGAPHVLQATMTSLVRGFLDHGYDREEIGKALNLIGEPVIPEKPRLQRALAAGRGHQPPAQQKSRAGARVNGYWDGVRATEGEQPEMASAAAGADVQTTGAAW
jgi:hypothetical protein